MIVRYYLEEWETVQKLLKENKTFEEIATHINHYTDKNKENLKAKTIELCKNYAQMSKQEIKDISNFYSKSKPTNIKQIKTLPYMYATQDGEIIYQHDKYWYKMKKYSMPINKQNNRHQLIIYNKKKYYRVHKIIAEAWFGDKIHNYKYVLFKDGNYLNTKPSNLILSNTHSVYCCEKCGKGIKEPPLCDKCKAQNKKNFKKQYNTQKLALKIEDKLKKKTIKLTEKQREILSLFKKGKSISEIAKEKNVSRQAISQVIITLKKKTGIK